MELYTFGTVSRLIEDYLKRGGKMFDAHDGAILLYDPKKPRRMKTVVIQDAMLNGLPIACTIRIYKRFPAKYRECTEARLTKADIGRCFIAG